MPFPPTGAGCTKNKVLHTSHGSTASSVRFVVSAYFIIYSFLLRESSGAYRLNYLCIIATYYPALAPCSPRHQVVAPCSGWVKNLAEYFAENSEEKSVLSRKSLTRLKMAGIKK